MGDIEQMLKFPYVLDYKLFERVELQCAEELINEYRDFFEYNKMQVAQAPSVYVDSFDNPKDEEEARIEAERIEHNRGVLMDHFEKHFGNKDFTEACLVGMKIDFYELQKILMAEHRRGIPITESTLNVIAPKLRTLASALVYAERIVTGLEKFVDQTNEKARMAVEFAKDGFMLLFERILEQDIPVPEYNRNKKEIAKIKTVDGYINYCERLFFQTEGK